MSNPTRMTRKGTPSTPRVPAARLEKSIKAVALVGPILVKREEAKIEPTMALRDREEEDVESGLDILP